MRSAFTGHFRLDDTVRDEVWSRATVSFDTNALLNMYRFRPALRQQMLDALEALSDRIWLPYQVASEFHGNRLSVIREQQGMIPAVTRTLQSVAGNMRTEVGKHSRNSVVDISRLRALMEKAIEECLEILKSSHSEYITPLGLTVQDDPVLERLGDLFERRVGQRPTETDLSELYQAADIRYSGKIPPGYSDAKKGDVRKYGDYILWEQLLRYCEAAETDLILVTDDEKEDWWLDSAGERIGGRPELYQEFFDRTSRHLILLQTPSFLLQAHERGIVPPERSTDSAATDDLVREEEEARGDVRTAERDLTVHSQLLRRIQELQQLRDSLSLKQQSLRYATSTFYDNRTARNLQQRVRQLDESELRALRAASLTDDPGERDDYLAKARDFADRKKRFQLTVESSILADPDINESSTDKAELSSRIRETEAELHALQRAMEEYLQSGLD